jgi:hypothetical protein
MHFSVTDLTILENKNIKGYLLGTTNKFLKSLPKLNADIIIDIDAGQIQIMNEYHKKILK